MPSWGDAQRQLELPGFYDSIYLALAQREHLRFIHADRRLKNAIGTRFPLARWIEDYQPAG